MDWYKFDIAAFNRATQGLTPREIGVYHRLLNLYYMDEGPFINDPSWLNHHVINGDRWDYQALIKVLSTFFHLDDQTNRYHNPRADEEIADYKAKRDKNKANANVRWGHATRNATGNASAMPKEEKRREYIRDDACGAYLDNGQKCGKPSMGKTAGQWHCREHDPYKR